MWLITIFIYLFFVFKFCMNIKKAKFIKRFYTLNCDHVFVICFSCARFDRIIDLLQPDELVWEGGYLTDFQRLHAQLFLYGEM